MLFNSYNFLVFLLIYIFFIYTFPNKWKNISIIFSGIFYISWSFKFYFIILIICFILRYFSKKLRSSEDNKHLFFCISILLLNLIFFKYTSDLIDFFIPVNSFNLNDNIILPIGISFYTFQSISYIIDLNKNKIKPYSFIDLLFYVSFFPQIIAGPIVRVKNFFKNYQDTIIFKKKRIKKSLILILWGFFLKIAVADNLALYSDKIFNNLENFNSASILVATFFYSFQIYTDFFAYSLIAIGICKFVNIDIPSNFNTPYFSTSIVDFWHRWHISLSTFLRDYLYIPLGGNKRGNLIAYRNIIITMTLGGIWHGSGLNFLFWGVGHGILIVLNKLIKFNFYIPKILKVFFVFIMVTLLWVPFRIDNIAEVLYVYQSLFSLEIFEYKEIFSKSLFVKCLLVLTILILVDFLFSKKKLVMILKNDYKFSIYVGVLLFLTSLFYADYSKAFIYFQF